MKRKKWIGLLALALCLLLSVPAEALSSIAIIGREGDGLFTDPVYHAIDFDDYINAAGKLITAYEDINSITGGDFASARLIVKSDRELSYLNDYDVAQALVDSEYHYLIQFYSPEEAKSCADYLSSLPYVAYAEPDKETTVPDPETGTDSAGVSSSSGSGNSWGVTASHMAEYAENIQSRGVSSKIVVAVVDTGIDKTHPFLSGRVIDGYDLVDNDNNPKDGDGHGTHVSGTVVDCTPGLNILIMPVRVLDDNGRGYNSTVGLGIQWAADHGANVISMSLGGSCDGKSGHYIDEKISYAISKNVTVVVAAGNESSDTKYVCPAHNTNCITVAAVDSNKNQANFSNYGDAVDIAAPGVAIKSCTPGNNYETLSGTSMATPHVSAAAAMLLYEDSRQTPSQVEKRLRDAAEDRGSSGWDKDYGAGFLDMSDFIVGGGGNRFVDVPSDAYYYKAVMWALEEGITTGTTQRTFSPNDTCTTAQILTFMWRAAGSPQPSAMVTSSAYYGRAMAWAEEEGISSSEISDSAGEACTRSAAMTYLWQDAGKPKSSGNPFKDVPNNSFYAQAVCWAVESGITNGMTTSTFSPASPCTRAQIMTFLYRYHVERVS